MNINKDEVLKIAKISRIKIYDHEIDKFQKQISDVITYSSLVLNIKGDFFNEIDNSICQNTLKEDNVKPFNSKEILMLCPESESSYFVVPKIIEK